MRAAAGKGMTYRINYYSYIHYHEINYEDDVKKYDIEHTQNMIRNKYTELKHEAGNRIAALNASLPNGIEVMDFVNQINQLIKQGANTKILGNVNSENIMNMFKLSTSSTSMAEAVAHANSAKEKARILNSYLKEIDQVMNLVKTLDNNLAIYYKRQMDLKTKSNIVSLFGNEDNMSVININKAGVTAFNNLKNKIDALRKTAIQNTGKGQKFVNRIIQYKHIDKDGKTSIRTRKAMDELYGISNQLFNIQGSIGEAVNAVYALEIADNIMNNFIKDSRSIPNMRIEVLGTGNNRIGGTTSKADEIIRVTYPNVEIDAKQVGSNENIGYDVTTNIRISTKAIEFGDTASGHNIKFLTTTVRNILSKVENFYQYYFLNGLAFKHYNKRSGYYPALNRYIAAQNFDTALTGAGFDNVVLLGFLDKIITIQDVYNSILLGKNYPRVSIGGITAVDLAAINPDALPDGGKDENPMTKNVYAIQRSHRIFNEMMKLQAKVMWQH